MTVENYVNTVLQPKIQGDGGWIVYDKMDGKNLYVTFRGECSKCLILNRCVAWIESEIKRDLKKDVKVVLTRKKPYFQDV